MEPVPAAQVAHDATQREHIPPIAVVTGANSGIGKATAAGLASRGVTVVLACRRRQAAEHVADEIRATHPGSRIDRVDLDLSSLASVVECADVLRARYDGIDVLVNNAGSLRSERMTTVDGFEHSFEVNYLSHYLLTRLLADDRTTPWRIVNVSSRGHRLVRGMEWADLQLERSWTVDRAYGQSKLAMILFTSELARRYGAMGLTAHASIPSTSRTNLWKEVELSGARALALAAFAPFCAPPRRAAQTSIHLASADEPLRTNGRCWARRRPTTPSRGARRQDDAARLWDTSERLLVEAGCALG